MIAIANANRPQRGSSCASGRQADHSGAALSFLHSQRVCVHKASVAWQEMPTMFLLLRSWMNHGHLTHIMLAAIPPQCKSPAVAGQQLRVRTANRPQRVGIPSFAARVHKAAVACPSLAHGRGLARWTMKTWISHVRLLHFIQGGWWQNILQLQKIKSVMVSLSLPMKIDLQAQHRNCHIIRATHMLSN